jgi:hypothetical protein
MAVFNLGYSLALFLRDKSQGRYLPFDVEEFLRRELEFAAKTINQSEVPFIAVHNLGILLEPVFHLEPARFLKEISKRIGLILLWEDETESPGYFFWDNESKDAGMIDLSDAYIQQITLET